MNNNDILESIDNIDSTIMESELNVITSLLDSYDKSLVILENYQGGNLDAFEMFNESFVMEADNKQSEFRKINKNGKKENIIKSILLVIPRLFKWLTNKIKVLLKRRKIKRLQ